MKTGLFFFFRGDKKSPFCGTTGTLVLFWTSVNSAHRLQSRVKKKKKKKKRGGNSEFLQGADKELITDLCSRHTADSYNAQLNNHL